MAHSILPFKTTETDLLNHLQLPVLGLPFSKNLFFLLQENREVHDAHTNSGAGKNGRFLICARGDVGLRVVQGQSDPGIE